MPTSATSCTTVALLVLGLLFCQAPALAFARSLAQVPAEDSTATYCRELGIDSSSLETAVTYCNAKGQPLCCEKLRLGLQRSLASYAAARGNLFDGSLTKRETCLATFAGALNSQRIRPNASSVLASCGITVESYSTSVLKRCGRQLGDWSTLAELAALPLPVTTTFKGVADVCVRNLKIADVGEMNPRSCERVECEGRVQQLAEALAATATPAMGSPSVTSHVCSVLVKTAIPALVQVPGGIGGPAGKALTRCLWDPSLTTKCTHYNLARIDYSVPQTACLGPRATANLCQATLVAVIRAASVYQGAIDGSFVPPPLQAESCSRMIRAAYAYYGITVQTSAAFKDVEDRFPALLSVSGRSTMSWACTGINSTYDLIAKYPIGPAKYRQVCAPDAQGNCPPDNVPCRTTSANSSATETIDDKNDPYYMAGYGCSLMSMFTYLATDYGTNLTRLLLGINCSLKLSGPFALRPNTTYLASPQANQPVDYEALLEAAQPDSSSAAPSTVGVEEAGQGNEAVAAIVASASAGALLLVALLGAVWWHHRRTAGARSKAAAKEVEPPLDGSVGKGAGGSGPRPFTRAELAAATDEFSEDRKVGQGSFGKVYRGMLADGTVVAVKRGHKGILGQRQFQNELSVLGKVDHPNLLRLIGYCNEGQQQMLVYPFMERGSVWDVLHGPAQPVLEWQRRLEISAAVARGLDYLQNHTKPAMCHGDVKASNVLLDGSWAAKVSDFGLSRVFPQDASHISTGIRGTPGYLDPEFVALEQFTSKSDVYSLGVLMLELLTGRMPTSMVRDEVTIVAEAKRLMRERQAMELVDPNLVASVANDSRVEEFASIIDACIRETSKERLTVASVCQQLEDLLGR